MAIVYGHNNFRVKTITPEQIGLFNEELKGCTFELRQKYGHLYWIPMIPMGQFWVVKKMDNQLYDCPASLLPSLENIHKKGISLFAFSGPLSALVLSILIPMYNKFDDAQRYKMFENDKKRNQGRC